MAIDKSALELVEGRVIRVIYHHPGNGFSVLSVRTDQSKVTVVGTLGAVRESMVIAAKGRWEKDPKRGEQFKAVEIVESIPRTEDGVIAYLSSGVIDGIGPTLARRIVGTLGVNAVQIITDSPDRLSEVRGIGSVKRRSILESWAEQTAVRDLMLFLTPHGVTPGRVVRIHKSLGARAIDTIKNDPFSLADNVDGIGFLTADSIAQKLGLSQTAPSRLRAGVIHSLKESVSSGHTFLPFGLVLEKASKLLGCDPDHLEPVLTELHRFKHVIITKVAEHTAVYLPAMHRAESSLARWVKKRIASDKGPIAIPNIPDSITAAEKRVSKTLADEQRMAVVLALSNPFSIITGGPGVGKTTTLSVLLQVATSEKLRLLLLAPTGRAAKRMTEATGLEAMTIHRALEWNPIEGRFSHDKDHPLEADLIICDESSMLDVSLAWSLLQAVPPTARLILVGDVDQLPSVGPGLVLADLIASKLIPVARLTRIHRQAAGSRIITAAHAINRGEMPESGDSESDFMLWSPSRRTEESLADWRESLAERLKHALRELLTDRLAKRTGLDPMKDAMVLVPMRKGPLGVDALNPFLRDILNPAGKGFEVTLGGVRWREGDRVMQTRNDYDLEVYNGDIGYVVGHDPDDQTLRIRYDSRVVCYKQAKLQDVTFCYAMTIHKSQGSEFPIVLMPITRGFFIMLVRNLLYTAVTRGKKLVLIMGDPQAVSVAVSNNTPNERYTGLEVRLALPTDEELIEK